MRAILIKNNEIAFGVGGNHFYISHDYTKPDGSIDITPYVCEYGFVVPIHTYFSTVVDYLNTGKWYLGQPPTSDLVGAIITADRKYVELVAGKGGVKMRTIPITESLTLARSDYGDMEKVAYAAMFLKKNMKDVIELGCKTTIGSPTDVFIGTVDDIVNLLVEHKANKPIPKYFTNPNQFSPVITSEQLKARVFEDVVK